MPKTTLGLIVGNRGFFPSHLCKTGRETMLRVLAEEGLDVVALGPEDTEYGSVVSLADSRKCAELFKKHADTLDGIVVTLPNFGEERGVADAIRFANLDVPVLIHAFPDDLSRMDLQNRRDSFCGKMSLSNNLRQYGIPFSLTRMHTIDPDDPMFRQDLRDFAATCRVAKGLRHARIGALGARPAAFNTVRYSEKLLELNGISVETLDLSEVFGRIDGLADTDPAVAGKRGEIAAYAKIQKVPDAALNKMAKLGVVMDRWMTDYELNATAVQCWTSMEEYFGVVPCTIMSMLSNKLLPSACETDVAGVVGMYALQLASCQPSALMDWNNNYGTDPDKAIVFHCSNLPAQIFTDIPVMDYQAIIAGTVGAANTYGTMNGRIKADPFSYLRVSTDDVAGEITAYLGEGEFTADPVDTFGGFGVVHVPHMQDLLQYICENGFEHHVAVNQNRVARPVYEALTKYLDWDVYFHS
jgi:L-fucose isomerase-like protein